MIFFHPSWCQIALLRIFNAHNYNITSVSPHHYPTIAEEPRSDTFVCL